jgi:hypothetical protein
MEDSARHARLSGATEREPEREPEPESARGLGLLVLDDGARSLGHLAIIAARSQSGGSDFVTVN